VDREGREDGTEGKGNRREPAVPPDLQPRSEPQQHAEIEERHARRPVDHLAGQ